MEQSNLFEYICKQLPKIKSIKLGTFFSGIGSPEKALKRIGVDYELMFFSEIDKYAIQSYCAIHNEDISKNKGDITKIKGQDLPYCDMWFGGFPCQDISLAGKQKGFDKDIRSRSSLGWEMIRLLDEVKEKPKYVIFENVANIMSEPMRPTLNLFKQDLEERGYTLYNEILNAKDYGIPQNRDRYFLVAILGNYYYKFPQKQELKLRLKDMLEDEVDEKYYLNDVTINKIQNNCAEIIRKVTTRKNEVDIEKLKLLLKENKILTNKEIALKLNKPMTLVEHWFRNDDSFSIPDADAWFELKELLNIITNEFDKSITEFEEKASNYDQSNRAYSIDGISPTLTTMSGGNQETKILIPEATTKGYAEATDGDGVYINRPHQKRGVVQQGLIQTLKTSCDDVGVVVCEERKDEGLRFFQDNMCGAIRTIDSGGDKRVIEYSEKSLKKIQNNIKNIEGCSNTITANPQRATIDNATLINQDLRIRKLTSLECYRLMGFDDEDYEKAAKVCSNSQLYKQAGNSIVVQVLEAIFRELFRVGD